MRFSALLRSKYDHFEAGNIRYMVNMPSGERKWPQIAKDSALLRSILLIVCVVQK